MEILRMLSTRELQAYGALCLHQFCREKHIKHPYIDELSEHLLTMLISSNLVAWEHKGAGLELSGRGDSIPAELETLVAGDILMDFHRLVEFVVEVGLIDMYAKSTKRPLNHLLRCLEIIDANGIERPDVPELFKDRMREEDAAPYIGEAYSQEEYEQVKSLFH